MPAAQYGINVLVKKDFEQAVDIDWLSDLSQRALESEGVERPAELGVVITDDNEILHLNRKFAGEDHSTDVLAFPMAHLTELEDAGFVLPPDKVRHLGEVVISYETARRQALDHHRELTQEVAHLLFHGILHVLGYDHAEPDEEVIMQAKVEALLRA
ncbi:MAG: rRNA maturation RNase YbeY [Dehalococcoidia bacterium]